MQQEVIKQIRTQETGAFYVFWLDELKNRMERIRQELGTEISVCYAMKANPFLIDVMNVQADALEVCSPGEYELCIQKQAALERVIVSGVNKTRESMERILSVCQGAGIFTIESPEHFEILSALAEEQQLQISVLLRLSSGNQFGMDETMLLLVLQKVLQHPMLRFYGIHYYSGTQKKPGKIEKELELLQALGDRIAAEYGVKPERLEYGPGLSVTYFREDKPADVHAQLQHLKACLEQVQAYAHITIEMGRFIAATCGSYVTGVVHVKETEGKCYAILDGGIHQMNYYGQLMGMKSPLLHWITKHREPVRPYSLCGSLCTVSDVLVREYHLPKLTPGDLLIFENCGAYSVTEGMGFFLSRDVPAVYTYDVEQGLCQCRRRIETWEIQAGCGKHCDRIS